VLRAPKNFHFYKSHPHSTNSTFALRAVARKTPRARSATDNMEEHYDAADLCSFALRDSLVIRVSDFAIHSSSRLPSEPARNPTGLIGTALGPEKDGFLSPLADANNRITPFQEDSYARRPPRRPRQNNFSRHPQPCPPLPLALRGCLRRSNLHPRLRGVGFLRLLRQVSWIAANTEMQPKRGVPADVPA
jgi:hypothetical protein